MADFNLKSLTLKLNLYCQISLEQAVGVSLAHTHYQVGVEHWLLKLLAEKDSEIVAILSHYNIELPILTDDIKLSLERYKTGYGQTPLLSQSIINWLREAWFFASVEFASNSICSSDLLYALLSEESLWRLAVGISKQFKKLSVDSLKQDLSAILANSTGELSHTDMDTNTVMGH